MKTVLLVEDNEDDVTIMKMACQRTGIPHVLRVVTDGNEAVDYLGGTGSYAGQQAGSMVDLIFLDLRMPGRDGHEVLEWIRSQPELKNIPVVILTAFSRPQDVDRAYSLGVTSFLHKNPAQAEFGQAVRVILKYWLKLNIAAPESVPSEFAGDGLR
jgi:two-component system, response regulator